MSLLDMFDTYTVCIKSRRRLVFNVQPDVTGASKYLHKDEDVPYGHYIFKDRMVYTYSILLQKRGRGQRLTKFWKCVGYNEHNISLFVV